MSRRNFEPPLSVQYTRSAAAVTHFDRQAMDEKHRNRLVSLPLLLLSILSPFLFKRRKHLYYLEINVALLSIFLKFLYLSADYTLIT